MSTTEDLLEVISGCQQFVKQLPSLEGYKITSVGTEEESDSVSRQLAEIADIIRQRDARMNPQPLSLEELRERNKGFSTEYTCVIKKFDTGMNWGAILDADDDGKLIGIWCANPECWLKEEDYGITWLAYDYPPKEAHV